MLIRGWAFINFFYLQGGRLFEVGAYSRLGTQSIKYGSYVYTPIQRQEFKEGNLHRTISAHIITQTNSGIKNRISNVVLF